MENPKRQDHERNSSRYLANIGERYVYDSTSLLYKHNTTKADRDAQNNAAQNDPRSPFWVSVRRDWLAVIISALTILLLAFTVHYARKQWLEANASAIAAQRTLCEIQRQTTLLRQETVGDVWGYHYHRVSTANSFCQRSRTIEGSRTASCISQMLAELALPDLKLSPP